LQVEKYVCKLALCLCEIALCLCKLYGCAGEFARSFC
jgi:hypothetical protein